MAKQSILNISDYLLVTDLNRKFAIRLGRLVYVISGSEKTFKIGNTFYIRPALKAGWYIWGEHRTFITEDEPWQTWKDSFDEVIRHCIKEKTLYIKTTDQIIKFDHQKVNK